MSPTPAQIGEDLRRAAEAVDRLLLEQGELDPLEYLLERGLIPLPDYLGWRQGRHGELQALLTRPLADVLAELSTACDYARRLRLTATPRPPLRWDDSGGALDIGASAALAGLCAATWRCPRNAPQLDLFQDSAWTAAAADLRGALAEQRHAAADKLLSRWSGDAASAAERADYQRLIEACAWTSGDAAARLDDLESRIQPLAVARLGARARDYLAPLWSALATALAGVTFRPESPRLHASYARARAGDWRAVLASVEAEPDAAAHAEGVQRAARWRRNVQPCSRIIWRRSAMARWRAVELRWDHRKSRSSCACALRASSSSFAAVTSRSICRIETCAPGSAGPHLRSCATEPGIVLTLPDRTSAPRLRRVFREPAVGFRNAFPQADTGFPSQG